MEPGAGDQGNEDTWCIGFGTIGEDQRRTAGVFILTRNALALNLDCGPPRQASPYS